VFTCVPVFFHAEDGIRDFHVTGVQTCALPISKSITTRSPRCTLREPGRAWGLAPLGPLATIVSNDRSIGPRRRISVSSSRPNSRSEERRVGNGGCGRGGAGDDRAGRILETGVG